MSRPDPRPVPTKITACHVLSELDIYRAALTQRTAGDAVIEAGRLLDLMLDRGDMDGRQVLLLIRRAIVQLEAMARLGSRCNHGHGGAAATGTP